MDTEIRNAVLLFQSGDREAFAQLVEEYQNLVTSTALAETGDYQRSEDIAQQSFLTAWRKAGELKEPNRFAGWLRGIARNLARNDRRLKANVTSRTASPLVATNEPASGSRTPSEEHARQEQRDMLWASLDRIPVNYREPMILFYREEQSVRRVAEQLDLTEDAVRQRLRRGREMLKQEIQSLVEELLTDTRPNKSFSIGVLAALPATKTAAQSAGILIGAKALFGKMLALGGLAGPFVGLLGGLFGAWVGTQNDIRRATSNTERDIYRKSFNWMMVNSIVYVVLLLVTHDLFPGAVLLWSLLYGSVLASTIYWQSRKVRALHRIHGRPDVGDPEAWKRAIMHTLDTETLWRNVVLTVSLSTCYIVLWPIVERSFVIASFALAIMLLHAWSLYGRASRAKTPPQQHRYWATAILENGCWQTCVLLLAYLFEARFTQGPLEGLPTWVPFLAFAMLPLFLAAAAYTRLPILATDLAEDIAAAWEAEAVEAKSDE